ncbi:ABC transporter ATP-binding protein [Egicoccus sp. AB-alg2]|uniref:ABC transporter ATP-binding protein n=1 Tax=Egicoccus sp. AB-alg2 TaxID=3242693 RepID=UPI00359CF386
MAEVASVGEVASLRAVGVRVGGNDLLRDVDLDLERGEHLAVLGPNGSGKTTLLRVLSTYRFPTRGTARVLGATFGAADLRALRPRIGFVSTALDDLLHVRAAALPLVAAAVHGGLWPPPHVLDDAEVAAAARWALARVGAGHLAERRVDTLSQGERQRVRIARALVGDPDLLLLDEPFAGLDLGGRESLLADLDAVLAEPGGPTTVLVTHHLEELPRGVRAALLLREGAVVASGGVDEVLRDAPVSRCFGLPVRVQATDGRFVARAVVAT